MVTRNNITKKDTLNNTSTVRKLVPKGTTFAVIADLSEQGFSGTAYLCVSKSQLSIIGPKGLLDKANLINVAIKFKHGKYVIHIAKHAYAISSISIVTGAGNQFTSRVAGIDGGVSPLLNALSSGGASVRGISGAKYYIAAVALAFVFVLGLGYLAYITLS